MLSPDPLRNPLGQHAPAAATAPSLADSSSTRRPGLRFAALLFGAAFVLCLVVYLALFVPGSWFPSAVSKTWLPRELALTRGSGSTEGDALAIKAPDASGLAVVSVTTDFRSSE